MGKISNLIRVVTREDLEKERTNSVNESNIVCTMKDMCTRRGEYVRCYLDNFINCPFYKTYKEQRGLDSSYKVE